MKEYATLIKWALAVAVVLLLLWTGNVVLGWKRAAEQNAQTVVQQNQTAEATAAVGNTMTQAVQAQTQDESIATQVRTEYVYRYRDAIKNDPSAAAFDDVVVPASLRNAARESRELRNRLTDDAVGSERAN